MSKEQLTKFFQIINDYDDFEYLLSVIICNAAPTLKKQKTASLITFSSNNRSLNNIWEIYKDKVKEKLNVSFFQLKKNKNSSVVLFYNKEMLELSIKNQENMNFLERFGYNYNMNITKCLNLLSKRFENMCPHEIGIFLGYPIEDVTTFVDCPNKKCKMVGYWKVYHDVEKAKVIFNKYDVLKYNAIEIMLKGCKPTDLVTNNVVSY